MGFGHAFRKLLAPTARAGDAAASPDRGSLGSLAARLGLIAAPREASDAIEGRREDPISETGRVSSFAGAAAKLLSTSPSPIASNFGGLSVLLLDAGDYRYLPAITGVVAWPDVGTPVRWLEEVPARAGEITRRGTTLRAGRTSRVDVDERDPRNNAVWVRPHEGGADRLVKIGALRVPAADIEHFRARAERVLQVLHARNDAGEPAATRSPKSLAAAAAEVITPSQTASERGSAPRSVRGAQSAKVVSSPASLAALASRLVNAASASVADEHDVSDPSRRAPSRRAPEAAKSTQPTANVDVVEAARRAIEPEPAVAGADQDAAVDEPRTETRRREANLSAMRLAAEFARAPRSLSDGDRRVLGAYSGWGGLSIDKAAGRFPPDFPVPEERGLIHEYYTPARVCEEVARVVSPLLPALAGADGRVHALEPSAGIGRFVRAFEGAGFEEITWHAVEWSALSAAMLRALRPNLDLYEGPFERWVAGPGAELAGRLQLIVANPPYGARSHALTEDPVRSYREDNAYAYFLRRGLDLLAKNGFGVFLIPSGFLSGDAKVHRQRREKVLRSHHLSCAFRLPSNLFPGAHLVTDLLFFRARGVTLAEVDGADSSILEGHYFRDYPSHILGRVVGIPTNDDDQTKPPQGRPWHHAGGARYEVVGEFTELPDIRERPLCAVCQHVPAAAVASPPRPRATRPTAGREARDIDPRLASASSLGRRVAAYLTAVAAQENEEPSLAWPELHRGLVEWAAAHGAPSLDKDLLKLAREDVGAQRLLAAFVPRTSHLIPALGTRPTWSPRYQGAPNDVLARAEFLYRQHRSLTREDLAGLDLAPLFAAGWCEDRPGELVPADVYDYGDLWPKVDRARMRADAGDAQALAQVNRLLSFIGPAVFDEIQGVSPRQGWLPLDLVSEWLSLKNYGEPVRLVRKGGLVELEGTDYDELESRKSGRGVSPDVVQVIGWINHDRTLFSPPHRQSESVDDVRLRLAHEWDQSFRAWCSSDETRRTRIEHAYQRHFQGFRAPSYSSEPLKLARWNPKRVSHPWQNAGARRVLANRGGLVAFDVGLGKTDCGLLCIAAARQEGWAKRPVIVVPKSIVWKWVKDIHRALPDYRVGVVGSKRKRIHHGPRAGQITSDTDSPAERAATWTRFMGGEYDVVVVTYQALPRAKMSDASLLAYAEATAAIQREVKLRQRNAGRKEGRKNAKLSERETAILNEGTAAWVAEMLEIPEGWAYDPGIAWEDIGVDLLVIDEAQNFKNLHLPEAREHGVPRFMGNAGAGSHRAWQVEFRCAAVRRKTGGAGVVLLSATPAKNSPLEFYSLLGYVDGKAFTQQGIYDPEAYVDRYCRIEPREVVGSDMDVHTRSACVGFKNLDELRATIFRYGEFRTAEQVGLSIPTPEVRRVEVDLDDRQEAKYNALHPGDRASPREPGQVRVHPRPACAHGARRHPPRPRREVHVADRQERPLPAQPQV